MNHQEAFDIAARHLLVQGKRSLTSDGACAYRGEGGLKCAIGALIPDDQYDPKMENWEVGIILTESFCPPILKSQDLKEDFLQDMQGIHDAASEYFGDVVQDLRSGFIALAEKWNLNTDVLNEQK